MTYVTLNELPKAVQEFLLHLPPSESDLRLGGRVIATVIVDPVESESGLTGSIKKTVTGEAETDQPGA